MKKEDETMKTSHDSIIKDLDILDEVDVDSEILSKTTTDDQVERIIAEYSGEEYDPEKVKMEGMDSLSEPKMSNDNFENSAFENDVAENGL